MTPNRTVAQLEAIRDLAARMAVGWAAYEATEAALAAPTMRAAGDNTRSGDVPDPVHAIAVSLEPHAETAAEIIEALGHLIAANRRLTHVRHHHSDIARRVDAAVRAARCSGYGEWLTLCNGNAVKGGLCSRCLKARWRDSKLEESA